MKKYKAIFVISLILSLLMVTQVMAVEKEVISNENTKLSSYNITKFNQAPNLTEQVENGDLPPLEERLPEDPYVVKPIEQIGKYGGTANVGSIRPESWGDDLMMMDTFNGFMQIKKNEITNHFAKKIEISSDKTEWTIHLRKGVKWSDGHPFTADDIMFWYNDVLLNEDLTPVVGTDYKAGGEVMDLAKIDDYTVQINFKEPKPYFTNPLVFMGWGGAFFLPKHYLKDFHPDYVSEEELKSRTEEAGFDSWYELFGFKNTRAGKVPMSVGLPTVSPYTLVKKESDRRVYERNPYYWKVDSEGNQLPYIDKIETEIVSNREILNGKILSGEFDFAAFENDIRNFPMYNKYQDEGNYTTLLWKGMHSSEVLYMINQTHQDPEIREIFQNVKFRRALSLAIDREEINETIYFGKAEPKQYTVAESSKFYKPEFGQAYIEYDPDTANRLLDEIGLDEKDNQGYRLRPDGKRLTFTIEYYSSETPKQPNVELVVEHWQNIGIDVNARMVSGELQGQRAPANLMDATLWHGGTGNDLWFPTNPGWIIPRAPGWDRSIAPGWGRWFQTDGEEGEEPPADIKELYNWWNQMTVEPDESKRIELAHNILEYQMENLMSIGTVANAPFPIIKNKNMKNVPDTGRWGPDVLWTTSHDPEQFFFDN